MLNSQPNPSKWITLCAEQPTQSIQINYTLCWTANPIHRQEACHMIVRCQDLGTSLLEGYGSAIAHRVSDWKHAQNMATTRVQKHTTSINPSLWARTLASHNHPCQLSVLTYTGLARTVYLHRIWTYGDFPAKNTVCTLYIPINVWFWPTLHIYNLSALCATQLIISPYNKLVTKPTRSVRVMGQVFRRVQDQPFCGESQIKISSKNLAPTMHTYSNANEIVFMHAC